MENTNYHIAAVDFVAQQTNDIHFDGQHETNNATVTEWHNDLSWLLNSSPGEMTKEQFFDQTPLYMKGSPGTEEQKNELFQASRMIIDLSSGLFDSSDPPPAQISQPILSPIGGSSQLTPHTGDSTSTTAAHVNSTQDPEMMDYFDRVKKTLGDVSLGASSVNFGASAMEAFEAGTVSSAIETGLAGMGVAVGEEATLGAILVTTAPEVAIVGAMGAAALGVAEAGYGIYQAFGGTGHIGFLDDLNSGVRGFFDSL